MALRRLCFMVYNDTPKAPFTLIRDYGLVHDTIVNRSAEGKPLTIARVEEPETTKPIANGRALHADEVVIIDEKPLEKSDLWKSFTFCVQVARGNVLPISLASNNEFRSRFIDKDGDLNDDLPLAPSCESHYC